MARDQSRTAGWALRAVLLGALGASAWAAVAAETRAAAAERSVPSGAPILAAEPEPAPSRAVGIAAQDSWLGD